MKRIAKKILLPCFLFFTAGLHAQDCVFKDTAISIDFGSARKEQVFKLSSLKNYRREYGTCPNDGAYSYTPMTSNCFNDDWLTITEDHTPNDVNGNMFVVNASENASDFFTANLAGFRPATRYELSVWMMNVCKINGGCQPLPPDIEVVLKTTDGRILAFFTTGKLLQSASPSWKRYAAFFTTPADVGTIVLRMRNNTNGGCGNDFTMDDIVVRECYPNIPPLAETKKPVRETQPVKPPQPEQKTTETKSLKKDTRKVITPIPEPTPVKPTPILVPVKPLEIPVPLLTRKNPVVKQIETMEGNIFIELYDNGEIDGDTVSIYHNNELIVSHKGLSEKPISFSIKVDKNQSYHEIVMVADNLGSIPPNTSLMVVTAKGKRSEVFISSSEQQNAKVIISLKP